MDGELARRLRATFRRRKLPFPEANLKQAWLIASATAIPNPLGTAPGWWVAPPAGGLIVALPGPPREMRPMWHDWVLPRLRVRGLGTGRVTRTYRTTGIGESLVAARLGEALLRASNPTVATYARVEAVDVRVSAVDEPPSAEQPGHTAGELVEATERMVLDELGPHVWGRGEETWADALQRRLSQLGLDLALVESGTRGRTTALLAGIDRLRQATVLSSTAGRRRSSPTTRCRSATTISLSPPSEPEPRRALRSAWPSEPPTEVPTPRSGWLSPSAPAATSSGEWSSLAVSSVRAARRSPQQPSCSSA